MAAEGLKITWQMDYYSPLCENLQVAVQFADDLKGKCLRSKKAFKSGDIVLSERRCVAAQNIDDKLENIRVCDNCLKSLETLTENCLRVRKKMLEESKKANKKKLSPLALNGMDGFPDPKIVVCKGIAEGCNTFYCSEECREDAWNHHHAAICPTFRKVNNETKDKNPVLEYFQENWVQGGINYADTFYVAFVVLSGVMTSIKLHGKTPEQAWLPYSFFISAPWDRLCFTYLITEEEDEDDEEAKRTKEDVIRRALDLLIEIHQPKPDEMFLFESEFFSRLLGMVLLNGQERTPPSPYLNFKKHLGLSESDNSMIEPILGKGAQEAYRDALNYSSKGQAIYCVGACMNHSCDPNVCVAYNDKDNEELVVTAVRDIEEGEELFISYIDEDGAREYRQVQLYNHYLFACQCTKCVKQLKEGEN